MKSNLKSESEVAAHKAFIKTQRKTQKLAKLPAAKNLSNYKARQKNPDIRKIVAGKPTEMWSEGLNAIQRKEGWTFGVPAFEPSAEKPITINNQLGA